MEWTVPSKALNARRTTKCTSIRTRTRALERLIRYLPHMFLAELVLLLSRYSSTSFCSELNPATSAFTCWASGSSVWTAIGRRALHVNKGTQGLGHTYGLLMRDQCSRASGSATDYRTCKFWLAGALRNRALSVSIGTVPTRLRISFQSYWLNSGSDFRSKGRRFLPSFLALPTREND